MIDRDLHPLWGAAYKVAVYRYGWLQDCYRVSPEDFRQTVSLACLAPDCQPGKIRNAIDREFYALARNYGFVRPSAGLPRGSTGNWKPIEQEIYERLHE